MVMRGSGREPEEWPRAQARVARAWTPPREPAPAGSASMPAASSLPPASHQRPPAARQHPLAPATRPLQPCTSQLRHAPALAWLRGCACHRAPAPAACYGIRLQRTDKEVPVLLSEWSW